MNRDFPQFIIIDSTFRNHANLICILLRMYLRIIYLQKFTQRFLAVRVK